ncbi:MAG: carbohydrate binding domain-containing protein [Chloroflexota bacterium]
MTRGPVTPVVRPGPRVPGPELLGGLVALSVVAILTITLAWPLETGGPAAPGATASPTAPPSIQPTPSAVVDPAIADLLIIVNRRLIRIGESLSQELARDPLRTTDVSTAIRELNGIARYGGEALDALGPDPAAQAFAERLGQVYASLREEATLTLGASVTNVTAYRRGAERLVEMLEALPPLQDELATLKVSRPTGLASTSPGPTPVPTTGATPVSTASADVAPSPGSSPRPVPGGPSQLVNGGFEDGVGTPWALQLAPGASATIEQDRVTFATGPAAARIDVSAGTPAFSGISLQQRGLRIQAGARFTFAIALRSEAARDVRIRIASHTGETYVARVAAASQTWSVTQFTFAAPISDDDAVLEIDVGRSDVTIWLDDVHLGAAALLTQP